MYYERDTKFSEPNALNTLYSSSSGTIFFVNQFCVAYFESLIISYLNLLILILIGTHTTENPSLFPTLLFEIYRHVYTAIHSSWK